MSQSHHIFCWSLRKKINLKFIFYGTRDKRNWEKSDPGISGIQTSAAGWVLLMFFPMFLEILYTRAFYIVVLLFTLKFLFVMKSVRSLFLINCCNDSYFSKGEPLILEFWPAEVHVHLNPLSANPTKWSNKLKQFLGKLPTNWVCLIILWGRCLKG